MTPLPIPGCRAAGTLERVSGPAGNQTPQDTDSGVPGGSGSPSLWLRCSRGGVGGRSDAGVPATAAGSGPSEAETLRGSQEKLRQPEGRPPVSTASSAALPAGGPRTPGLKRSQSGRPRTHARPVRRRAPPRLGQYLSVSRAARLSRALRVASSPPLFNGAARALRPASTRPIERATRRRLASRAPSNRGGAPWRGRPLLQGRAVPLMSLAQTVLEPRILAQTRPCLPPDWPAAPSQ